MTSYPRAQAPTPKRPVKMTSNQSLNHLLNFTLPPRQIQPQNLPRRSRKAVNPVIWNKERFVNAQYRFVMNPSGDYTVHFADPDIFFHWHDILQVIIPRSSAFSVATVGDNVTQEGIMTCPICLSPPTAPRMTKCGHVYCFPCILHYLSMSDNLKWAKCPICFDTVNEKQLKSVKWYDEPQDDRDADATSGSSFVAPSSDHGVAPRAGSTMRMRLMERPQMTTLALPRSHTWPSDLLPPHQAPFYFLPDVYNYAKFMLATPDYLIANLSDDLNALNMERRMMTSMQDELSISFIDAAEQKLRHQIAKAAALESPQLKEAIDRTQKDHEDIERRHNIERARKLQGESKGAALPEAPEAFLAIRPSPGHFVSSRSPLSTSATPESSPSPAPISTTPTNTSSNNRSHRQRRNVNPPPPSTQTYYYYQAASGLPIFLHPLDIKILFSHFNSYASFPDTITVRVESASEGTVNDDLRKRCKYLAHIPEGADVVFIEADLEGVVGQEGLKNFEGAIKLRKSRRKEKGKKDDRARIRAEEREREKVITPWSESVTSIPPEAVVHPEEVEGIVGHEPPTPQTSGVWGARSFASAANSTSRVNIGRSNTNNRTTSREITDEWELDAAWHEFEQQCTTGNGNRKRGNKLVVLGGGAGGRRR